MSDAPLFQHTDEQEAASQEPTRAVVNYNVPDQPAAIPAGLTPGGTINAGLHGLPAVLPQDIAPQPASDEVATMDPTTPH